MSCIQTHETLLFPITQSLNGEKRTCFKRYQWVELYRLVMMGILQLLCKALNLITKILNGLPLVLTSFGLSYVEKKLSFLNDTNIYN